MENADGPGYDFVMLGACAMSLGASLAAAQRDIVRSLYTRVGLARDAVTQMKDALDPDTGYKNGVAGDFGSLGVRDISAKEEVKKEDLLFPGTRQINTRAPVPYRLEEWEVVKMTFFRQITKVEVSAKDLATGFANLKISPNGVEKKVKKFDEKACAGCGAEQGLDGNGFKVCGKCGKSQYCSKECQKAHWQMAHKKECKV